MCRLRGKVGSGTSCHRTSSTCFSRSTRRCASKTLLISKTLGIEGKKLLTPEDDYEILKEFNAATRAQVTQVEDLHLEYQGLLQADAELEGRLRRLPGAVFSGKESPKPGTTGVFFCYALPALDAEMDTFTEAAGTVRWYLHDLAADRTVEDPSAIVEVIRSDAGTPRRVAVEQPTLVDVRKKVEKHIKNTYLKRIDAPVGVKPALKCWMELNER